MVEYKRKRLDEWFVKSIHPIFDGRHSHLKVHGKPARRFNAYKDIVLEDGKPSGRRFEWGTENIS